MQTRTSSVTKAKGIQKSTLPCASAAGGIKNANPISLRKTAFPYNFALRNRDMTRFEETGRMVIIDAGSGIRSLGNHMVAHDFSKGMNRVEIYLTHTHWDHIHGFPFFSPLYKPGTKFKIYGPASFEDNSLEEAMAGQLTYRYFPVRLAELACELEYADLKEGSVDIGDGITLKTKLLNHPTLCLGYRFEYREKAFCTAYDTEPYYNVFSDDPDSPHYDQIAVEEGEQAARDGNDGMREFFDSADLVIHDAQYAQEEYETSKIGWGHTSIEQAITRAKESNVSRLALFHHDPDRTDEELDRFSTKYCCSEFSGDLEVFFAREGMRVTL